VQTFWKQAVFLMIGVITLTGAGAHAQTDISASVFGALNNSTSGNGATQSSANSGGGMIGLRHIFRPLPCFELTYREGVPELFHVRRLAFKISLLVARG